MNINEKEKHASIEELNELRAKSTALEEELKKELMILKKTQLDKDIEVYILHPKSNSDYICEKCSTRTGVEDFATEGGDCLN